MDIESKQPVQDLSHDEAAQIFSASRVAFVLTDPSKPDNPIVYVNRAFEELTGYSAQAAVGRNCRFLQTDTTDTADVARLRTAIEANEEITLVLENERADGEKFLNALLVTPIYPEGASERDTPQYFLGVQRSVEKDHEKEQLESFEQAISEIQHRVKNHLSMILGLIRMKTREFSDKEVLTDLSRRIESLQLLYEEMSASRRFKNDDTIQLGAYIGRVANAIAHIDGRPGVRMNIDIVSMEVQTDQAARIGLVVSEILTNCMQHAFRDQETGLVEIRAVHTDNGGLRVTVSDDGVGLPDNVDWPNDGGLGSRIVLGLLDGLGGSIDVIRASHGTVVIFDAKTI